jgi:hypothetical protein
MNAPTVGPVVRNDGKLNLENLQIWRVLWFAFTINFWPVLLYLSQKAFVPIALIANGWGDRTYRKDVVFSLAITLIGLYTYLNQPYNQFQNAHIIGFILFVWSMPIINYATRKELKILLGGLSYLTLLNALLGLYFLVFDVDLLDFRGINRIESNDGYTERLFFEAVSLAALFQPSAFPKLVRWIALGAVVAFVVVVAKSVVVVLLLGINLGFPYFARGSSFTKASVVIVGAVGLYILYIYLPTLRPDIYLSLIAKQTQFDVLLSFRSFDVAPWGWGSFVPELANSIDQPYQIEMQLPMLLLQLGGPALAFIMGFVTLLIFSNAERKSLGLARAIIYFAIGFNNPWLFVPSWYLTTQLLFRSTDVNSNR